MPITGHGLWSHNTLQTETDGQSADGSMLAPVSTYAKGMV